jgi:hypothetical protein
VLIERMFKSGKSPATLPSIQYFTSPSFFPGVFAFTINSTQYHLSRNGRKFGSTLKSGYCAGSASHSPLLPMAVLKGTTHPSGYQWSP